MGYLDNHRTGHWYFYIKETMIVFAGSVACLMNDSQSQNIKIYSLQWQCYSSMNLNRNITHTILKLNEILHGVFNIYSDKATSIKLVSDKIRPKFSISYYVHVLKSIKL